MRCAIKPLNGTGVGRTFKVAVLVAAILTVLSVDCNSQRVPTSTLVQGTPTASAVPSPTPTQGDIPTQAPAESLPPVSAPAATATPTTHPTHTPTPTSTAVPTLPATPSPTLKPTLASQPTPTLVVTPTKVASPTPMLTPTISPTPAPTRTPTLTPTVTLMPTATFTPTPSPTPTATPATPPLGRYRLPVRGLYVQIERRGVSSTYWSGQVIKEFNDFDPVVGTTVAKEAELQLDAMRAMGINAITWELRNTDSVYLPIPYAPPECNLGPGLGLLWPQPTATELANLPAFLDLVQSKGMRVFLRLVNTHMDEEPRTNSETWLRSVLQVIKDHPAIDLILFEGNTRLLDSDGDGVQESCGIPAEPPLWMGPGTVYAQYVRWAIDFARGMGIPARKLSAEAIVGDFFTESRTSTRNATDGHFWPPIVTLKMIFDDLGIPNNQRAYAISFYEHRKCITARWLQCVEEDAHLWAEETLIQVLNTIGAGNGARVVAPEMGYMAPTDRWWSTEQAVESLVFLMEKYGVEGGAFWRWTSFFDEEDKDPTLADPVKRRGVEFTFNRVQKEILDLGGFHLTAIPNGSFEAGAVAPDNWTKSGNGTMLRYLLAGEQGQPEVPSRGLYALRLVTGPGLGDGIGATSESIAVSPNTTYTTTANMRFGWTGDPNPNGDPATRPQVFVSFYYLTKAGQPSTVRAQDVFRFYQEDATQGFDTFPLLYTTPSDASSVHIEIEAARNGLPVAITLDADNLR